MDILKKIANFITVGHKEAIKNILSTTKKNKLDLTPREFENEAKRLALKLSNKQKILSPLYAEKEGKISSATHNSNMESVYIDLVAIYKQADAVGATNLKQKDVMSDSFNKARAAILKLINDARVFTIRNRNPEFDDIKLVNFNISRNVSNFAPSAFVDPDSRLLKLPQILKRRNHLPNRDIKKTDIKVELYGGRPGQLGKQFPIKKSVDARPETFWADIIYSDVPIQTTYNRWSPNENGSMIEIVNGPYAVVTLTYGAAEAINQIKLLPFARSAVKVLEITYRPNLSSKIKYQIPGFKTEETLDWIEYNFETIFACEIEIVFAQENYSNLVVHVPKGILYATDFMLRLQDARAQELAEIPNSENIDFGGNRQIYDEAIKDLSSIITEKELNFISTTKIDVAGKTILSIGETLSSLNQETDKLLEDVSAFTNALPKDIANEIEVINKTEYLIGAREIETNYIVYSPVAYYESEKFEPAATVSNVEIEVDEHHPSFKSPYGEFYKTSTEWEVEFADDRKVPIFPKNLEENGLLKVKSERLFIESAGFYAYTRFRSYTSWAQVRENDSILIANVDYSIVWNSDYNGRLQIQINKDRYDLGKIYTVDYYAHPSSKSIDAISLFTDKSLAIPDSFNGTKSNNSVKLLNFPYINYNIINADVFEYNNELNSYQYNTPAPSFTSGFLRLYPEWTNSNGETITGITGYNLTGSGISPGIDYVAGLSIEYSVEPYSYYVTLSGLPGLSYKLDGYTQDLLLLSETPRLYTGLIGNEIPTSYFSGNFTGTPPSGFITIPYSIDVAYIDGDQIFAGSNLLYSPLDVTVGGKQAKNITSYQNLEQPAFNVANTKDGEYEYVQDGNILYFNQPVDESKEIKANYRWMTQYVKVNCTLRANKAISPTITPTVNEYRLLLNTTIL